MPPLPACRPRLVSMGTCSAELATRYSALPAISLMIGASVAPLALADPARSIPGTRRFSDVARHEHNERIPGFLAFRVESGIVYFNVDHVFRVVLDCVEAEAKTLRLVVCDLSTSPNVE